ncbi:Wzz/FepE/Etk N-terminal domain-containing protein [Geomonas sp. Red32]|uniref:GumC family protein n=1 Tax=Geomonas sp. Red32 TaxID=2912856 RepID=UPI00202CCD60|nr:Wzz/FepE/Etk N-terminal domain-containing protein [Geomonas sp. Red32]MCM0081362.1 Wzz/FepE/Etk N-terminal domain-containing protein [Geomonas sp. Red32]
MTHDQYDEDMPEEQETSIWEILHLLAKRKIFILSVCFITAVAAIGYTLTLPNVYTASTRVLPPQKEAGGGLSALLGQAGGLAGLAGGLTGGTDLFIGILKSRSVGDAVIQKLSLQKVYGLPTIELTRAQLDLSVKAAAGTDGIIVISADAADPKLAATIANAMAEELGRTTVRLNLTKVSNERIFLEKRLDVVRGELKQAEEEMKSFAEKNKMVQFESQTKASFESISILRNQLTTKEMQLSTLRASLTDESPEVRSLKAGIAQLRSRLAQMQGGGGGADAIPAFGKVPELGVEYARRMRDLKTREAVFEQLSKQYEVAKLNEAKDASAFQIIDPAIPPAVKTGPKRGRSVILATIVAFFASVVIVLVRDRFEKMPEESRKSLLEVKQQLFSLR